MTLEVENPEHIYLKIQTIVNEVVSGLSSSSDDETIEGTKAAARALLKEIQQSINRQVQELKEHADWKTFTIAFYGETNAGKSTIIETLRILLNEAEKQKEQQRFKKWQEESGITESAIAALRNATLEAERQLEVANREWSIKSKELELLDTGLTNDRVELAGRVEIVQRNANLWQRFLWLFSKPEEFSELEKLDNKISDHQAAYQQSLAQYEETCRELTVTVESGDKRNKQIEQELKQVQHLADGTIIGNGRSDFTLDTQRYLFTTENQTFALLDVPGIEGKESKVESSIWEAVKKSHAVFYVTGKAAAPQKGENKNKGTLEKIKDHLGAQTEVWSIYNKRITNPMQLEKGQLISDGEQESLKDLDNRMSEQLGENYQNCLPLSAYPAFLSASDCLLPGSAEQRNKSKFLARYSAEELLAKTNMQFFIEMLTGSMVENSKEKIERSNVHKTNQVVVGALEQVEQLQAEKFSPLLSQLEKEFADTEIQIDTAFRGLRSRLQRAGDDLIDEFKRDTRRQIYEKIEDDISNDRFKSILKREIQDHQEVLSGKLPDVMNKELSSFEDSLQEIIERFQTQTGDLLGMYEKISDSEIELKIDLDNGINLGSLLMTILGGGLLFWNPVGWIVLGPALASIAFQVYKSVRSFFSSSYKISQQRKSTDENLIRVKNSLCENFENSLDEAMPELKERLEAIKKHMRHSIAHIKEIHYSLQAAQSELSKLSRQLEH